jgi:hypothetical protein
MIYPSTTFAGQKVTICNRYVEQFRQEANEHSSGVKARALRAELDALMPEAYHGYRLIWLNIKWQDVMGGNEDFGFPGLSLDIRLAATNKKDEALQALKEFYKYQREIFTPTIKSLLHERHKAEQECRQDETHGPTLADFKRVDGKLSLDAPSKSPMNESTNAAFAMRVLELYPDIDMEYTIAVSEVLGNAKKQARNSDFWDNRLDKELVRVNINLPEPPDPPEDFTTYTKFTDRVPDPLSITATTIIGTAITRNEDTYVYDDKEGGHFSGDFTHQFDTNVSNSVLVGNVTSWALTNDVDDSQGLIATSKSFLELLHVDAVSYLLVEVIAGVGYADSATLTSGQTYYNTMDRDENVGSFGQLSNSIFSDIDRTMGVDVLSLLLHAKLDLRYVFGLMSYDSNDTQREVDITVSNLDLGEAVAAAGRRRRMLIGRN